MGISLTLGAAEERGLPEDKVDGLEEEIGRMFYFSPFWRTVPGTVARSLIMFTCSTSLVFVFLHFH